MRPPTGGAPKRFDPRLYLVTDPTFDFEPRLTELFDAGVTLIQVRDKRADDDALARQVERVLERAQPFDVRVLVNDRVDVAARVGADGVHVGQSDLPTAETRKWLGEAAIVGLSVESMPPAPGVEAASYVAASPVWTTPTKTDTAPALGLSGVRAWAAAVDLPLVGIGGIDADRAESVIAAGASGVAVVSAILAAPDPASAARALRRRVDCALRAREGERDGDHGG